MTDTTFNLDNIDLGSLASQSVEDNTAQEAKATQSVAINQNADEYARTLKLARQAGVPVESVQSNPKQVELDLKLNEINFDEMSKRSPNTTKFVSDYDNAVVAQEDIPVLERLERIFNFDKTFKNFGKTTKLGFKKQGEGLLLWGADNLPDRREDLIPYSALPLMAQDMAPMMSIELAENLGIHSDEELAEAKEQAIKEGIAEIRRIKEEIQTLTPEDLNTLEQGVRGGTESLVQMAPGVAATVLTRGKTAPMLFSAGFQTYAGSYAEGREGGLTADQATFYASIDAGIEVLTELLPTKTIEGVLKGQFKGKLTKGALQFAVREMGTEQLATLGQSLNAYAFDLDEQLKQATSLEEMIDIQLQRQAVTAVATIVAGGAQTAGFTGVRKTLDYMAQRNQNIEQQTNQEQQFIDDLNQMSSASKMRERDAERFKQFIEKNDGDKNTQIYIDGAQLQLYLNSLQVEDDPAISLLRDRAAEASALGGDAAIPVSDFATYIAGSDHFTNLREFMSLTPETNAPFRQEQAREETQRYMEDLVAQAQENVSEYVEAQEIFENARDQLIDSGAYSPQVAAAMAQVVPAWATVYARDNGISVQEAYQRAGLKIVGPQTGRAAELQQVPPVEPSAEQIAARVSEPQPDRRRATVQPNVEERQADRRQDTARRERIASMSAEDQYKAIYGNELTGLNNRRAFEEDVTNASVVASIDADSLKTVNDNLGQDAGDNMLRTVAQALNAEFGPQAYHISGDEFYVLGDDQSAINDGLTRVREALRGQKIVSDRGEFTNADITWGMANEKNAADLEMKAEKKRREEAGERAPRGETLPGTLTLNERQQDRGYYEPSRSLIRLTEAANLSTFLHEFAHFMYEMELTSANPDKLKGVYDWINKNKVEVAKEANSYLGREGELAQPVYHGTPHKVDKFTTAAIGSGEGTLYYGWGLYFTGRKKLADQYADILSKGKGGSTVKADIPEDNELLDWDKKLSEQPAIMEALGVKDKSVYLPAELRPDMYGQEVYDALAKGQTNRGVTNKKEASLYLDGLGIPGLRYFGEGSHNFVIWNDDRITIPNGALKQESETPDFRKPIPKKITEKDVTAYTENSTTGDETKDAAIRRAIHEQFARGFEAYLMEGKAPSTELRNVFAQFARWLSQIYQTIRGSLRVNLDDQIRDVFDRMLATEEQLNAARARQQYEPMFTDAAMAGMTEEEFTKYQEHQQKAKAKESETLRDKLIKEITRQTQSWWKREKADIVDEQLVSLRNQPVYRASESLKGEKIKLDHATVKEMVGEQVTDKRGRTSTRIPAKLHGMTVTGAKGVHPDEAAAFFGFNSGDEMIQEIISAPTIKQSAESNAEQIMRDRHGDMLNDGTIEQQADEALQNEERGELILSELRTLARQHNTPTLDRQTIKAMAEENIAKLSFRQIHPGKYRKAEIRAAQEAASMLAAGNTEGAMQAKSRQVMNYYLGMAATNAKNETVKIVDRMTRYNKKSVKESVMKAGEDYWSQIVTILERFEFRKSATLQQVNKVNQDINTWMREKIDQEGDGLVLSPAVLNESYVTHWKNVSFSDLKGIEDSVKNIEHVARYANKLTRMGEEIEFKKLVDNWVTKMNEQDSRFTAQRTDVTRGRNWGRWAMAQMTKIPWMASWLDGGERVGISHQIMVQPFTDAYDAELRLWKEVGNKVMQAIENRDRATRKRHNRKIHIPAIKDEKNDGNLYGHQVIAVALNTGNQGNLRKMLLGEGWAQQDDDASISIDNPKLQAVLEHMTKEDWEMVQLIWDQMDALYPQLAETHRRTTGLTPPKVEATPVETPYGKFRGGYYPVKYDSNRSHQAMMNEDRMNAEVDSMFNTIGSIQASVNAGATNERTKYFAPIRLSLDVVPDHFQEVIHYITHHDAVREVNKLIRNQQVAETIKAKLGPEEYAQLRPWLNDIAKDGRGAPTKMFWDTMLQRLRFGTTLGVMGFKASTGIIQISGLSNTIAEVGLAPVMQSARGILGSPSKMKSAWEFANENSKVLNHRTQTMDREIKNAMGQLQNKRGILAAVQEVSMKHIALIQTYMVDLPSWYAAYIKSMKEYGDERRAYQYADWVVENVQGSGATKDLARIMRNQTETGRMFTMFMTFFSSLWNTQRDLVKGTRGGRYSVTTIAAKGMFLITIPVLFEMMMRGELGADEDEGETEEEALQRALTKVAVYPVQSIPFVRDIVNASTGDYGYNISPIAGLLEQGTRTIPEIATRAVTDEEITEGQVKGATKFVGAATGVPGTAQAWATGEHLYDVLVEGEDFTVREFLFGPDRK